MARIYVASSWRNKHQPTVVRSLRRAGHSVYDFRNPPNNVLPGGFAWQQIDPKWESWTPTQYIDVIHNNPICAMGFMSDLRAMEWADTCVLVNPCGRSAHLEAGYMAGRGKRVIFLLEVGDPPDLMYLLGHHMVTTLSTLEFLLADKPEGDNA